MRRLLPLLILLLLLQSVPPLRLEASTARSEFLAGDRFTVSAYLFNDGSQAADGDITVTAPKGFEPLSAQQAAGDIPAGRAMQLNSSYRVASAVPGLYTFTVASRGQTVAVVIRVGPVRAPPAVRHVYLPLVR